MNSRSRGLDAGKNQSRPLDACRGAHMDSYLTALAATDECDEVVLADPDAKWEEAARRVLGKKLTHVSRDAGRLLADQRPAMALSPWRPGWPRRSSMPRSMPAVTSSPKSRRASGPRTSPAGPEGRQQTPLSDAGPGESHQSRNDRGPRDDRLGPDRQVVRAGNAHHRRSDAADESSRIISNGRPTRIAPAADI